MCTDCTFCSFSVALNGDAKMNIHSLGFINLYNDICVSYIAKFLNRKVCFINALRKI
jgi:hypothetical protein